MKNHFRSRGFGVALNRKSIGGHGDCSRGPMFSGGDYAAMFIGGDYAREQSDWVSNMKGLRADRLGLRAQNCNLVTKGLENEGCWTCKEFGLANLGLCDLGIVLQAKHKAIGIQQQIKGNEVKKQKPLKATECPKMTWVSISYS
ncbi:hypothetical protein U1Q18_002438 [Sarracenia purpurea var. burkii]